MADAGIDLSIRTDSTQAASGVREVEDAIRRAGRTSEEASRRSADASQRNLQLYREESRILDLRARGRNDIADALRAEVDMRRMGMRLERELRVSEEEGLRLARRRVALERELAEQAARRGAGGNGGSGGGGGPHPPPPPPPGGGPPPPPPPGGGPGRRGGGGGGGGLRDFGIAYQIAQDGIQGGMSMGLAGVAIGTANQVPQLIDLVRKYQKTAMVATAATATIGSYLSYSWMRDQMDDSDESPAGQRRIQNFRANQTKRWNADRAKLRTDGAAAGEAESLAHSMRGRDFDVDAALRESRRAVDMAAADQARQNERAAMLADPDLKAAARIDKIAALDKRHMAERAAAARQAMDEELRLAQAEEAAVQKRKETLALLMTAEKERIDLGRMATDEEIKGIAAAKAEAEGLDERMKAAQARLTRLEQHSKLLNLSDRTTRPLEEAGIDAQADRDKTAEAVAEARKNADDFVSAGRTFVKAMLGIAEDIPKIGREQNKARGDREKEMRILELRSRGQNRRADRLQRNSDIEQAADALQKGPGLYSREDALKAATREHDLRNPSRRIRGAGFGGPGRRGKNPSRTGFTGIDGVEYTGANRDGGLDIRNFKGANGDGGLDGQSWGGANGDGGLDALRRLNDRSHRSGKAADKQSGTDGLDALQNQNRKIRGAGFKGEQKTKETDAPQQPAGGGGAGPLTAILGAISGLRGDIRALTSASRTIRR